MRISIGWIVILLAIAARGPAPQMVRAEAPAPRAASPLAPATGGGGAWTESSGWPDGPTFEIERLPPIGAELPPEELDLGPQLPPADKPLGTATGPRPAPGSTGGPLSGSPFKIGAFWAPATNLSNQPTSLSINEQHMDLAFPLVMPIEGAKNIWLGIGKFQRLELSTTAVLPDSQRPVPNQLWNYAAGAMNIRKLANDRTLGAMLLVGSASDEPFASGREITVTALGFYHLPARNPRDSWNFSVFYSPVGQIPYPLPGVAYVWRPNEYFTANIGLPMSVNYRPTDTLTITAGYTPLTTFNLMVRQELFYKFCLYGGYQVTNNGYFLADRAVYGERFYVFDQRVGVGLDRPLGRGFILDLSGAYLFDRQLFQATTFAGDRTDQLNIDPGVGLTLNVMWAR
ncbi:MAG: hypothetical protein JNG90_02570 [Planctomycetaceae bacterium]|nr:hypothetical protein [Planctomycetaceae bacterium]